MCPVIIQIVGRSGAGKSLVIERAVRRLVARRLLVAVVKHSHHSPDVRGKDSSRFAAAGAALVVFASQRSFISFRGDVVRLLPALPADIVLVEGYSRRSFGGLRLRISAPDEATALIDQIVLAAPVRPKIRALRLDGRRTPARGPWRFVAELLASSGVREVRPEP